MTKKERLERQKERFREMTAMEDELHSRGYENVAGVDEAGRGPLAGPVAAAAVVLPEGFSVLGIDDSKKLSAKKRDELYDIITRQAICGVGIVDNETIDRINILQATKQAMSEALAQLDRRIAERYEGTEHSSHIDYILLDAVELENAMAPQEGIVKGDAKILAVAAASIVAKVTRDRMMIAYAEQYPGYGFEKHKGYGTKQHYEGIDSQGICPIHRKTFLKKHFGK